MESPVNARRRSLPDCAGAVAATTSVRAKPIRRRASFIAGGGLFDRDRLGEAAGLVDVAAAADGDVVGEQLQGHGLEQRRKQLGSGRELEGVVGGGAGGSEEDTA